MKLDLIGDIHGELPALQSLLHELGYRPDADGDPLHPDDRHLLFLGDLVDRGAHSLEVVELVQRLSLKGRASCVMGNHEYNLVAWSMKLPRYEEPKDSNRKTTEDVNDRRARWNAVLPFLRELPIGIALPDLRVIHANWHVPSLNAVAPILTPTGTRPKTFSEAQRWIASHIAVDTPFTETGLKPGLPPRPPRVEGKTKEDAPHEILIKGFEFGPVEPFPDSEGKLRKQVRVTWWLEPNAPVLRDRAQVVGHYWNLPPIDDNFCPPFPSGHQKLRRWQSAHAPNIPARGRANLRGDVACIDFQGLTLASKTLACVGALRWPEREIVWATGTRTRSDGSDA